MDNPEKPPRRPHSRRRPLTVLEMIVTGVGVLEMKHWFPVVYVLGGLLVLVLDHSQTRHVAFRPERTHI